MLGKQLQLVAGFLLIQKRAAMGSALAGPAKWFKFSSLLGFPQTGASNGLMEGVVRPLFNVYSSLDCFQLPQKTRAGVPVVMPVPIKPTFQPFVEECEQTPAVWVLVYWISLTKLAWTPK